VKPWTIRDVLAWTAEDLASRHISSARLDAEVLLAHVLETDRLGLYLDLDRPLGEPERVAYREMIARRRQREPVAYLTGEKEFWSLSFTVSPDVLIPRPDTEVLVEEALEVLPADAGGVRVVDVGTGSGCVAMAVASERPALRVLALDIDPRAAAVAAHNASRLELSDRVDVVVGDLLDPVGGGVALVVANLPYIPTDVLLTLEPEVSRWEPRHALDGGADGLRELSRMVSSAADVVVPGGALALEIGNDQQADQVASLLEDAWRLVKVRRDYSGAKRVVVAQRQ